MIFVRILTLCSILLLSSNIYARQREEILVSFQSSASKVEIQQLISAFNLSLEKKLSRSLQIYLLSAPTKSLSKKQFKDIKSSPIVRYAQKNHKVDLRSTFPSSSLFEKQWGLYQKNGNSDIRAPWAWDFGTGGKNRSGDDVVIAVVDSGFDINHVSLKSNLWSNTKEIPNDGVDNDQNGYVDDVHGWNAYDNNGKIPVANHGTHVAGIAGASESKDGSVGIMWNTQIMTVAGSSGKTSIVVEAYSYILEQKKSWLKSKGQNGANVVVINSSFGIDFADCQSGDYPVWNDLYNALGAVGILSATATTNRSADVDSVGDVPTQCDSPYIISVTNTTSNGTKFNSAGFGAKSIDLGAPGTEILSTLPGDQFGLMTGTSMATPHVTGAVGLLNHVASSNYLEFAKNHPSQAALVTKEILLKNTSKQADLSGATVSGGRLNLEEAAKEISSWIQN